jgi:hypothetical protein
MSTTADDGTQETNKLTFAEIMELGRTIRAAEKKEKLALSTEQVSALNAYGSKCCECDETNLLHLRVTIERFYWAAPTTILMSLRSQGYPREWQRKTMVLPSGRRSIEPGDGLVVMCEQCRKRHQEQEREARKAQTGHPYEKSRGASDDWRRSWKIQYPSAPVYETEAEETVA